MSTPMIETVRRMTDEKLSAWQTRAFVAVQDPALRGQCPGCGFRILRMILRAALNIHTAIPGKVEVPHLGDNAVISADGWIWSQFTDVRGHTEPSPVCKVEDEFNPAVRWLLRVIDANEAEVAEITSKFQGWIAQDVRQLAETIERQREEWKQ